jgi:hypothetical protein
VTAKLIALPVAALAAAAVLLLASTPAGAVQTASLGMAAVPGPGGAARVALVHQADGARYDDAVQVTNRSRARLPVQLSVVGVTRSPQGIYQLGVAGDGVAGDVSLGLASVVLAPGQAERVPVEIRSGLDRTSTRYAAVTAVAGSGGGSVVERLAVLIELTPVAASATSSPRSVPPAAIAAGIILLLLALAVLVQQYRTRRRTRPDHQTPTS